MSRQSLTLHIAEWRTKKGAIEMMGAMAYLAPRQLSQSLPTIIPLLTEVMTDTHTQVRSAANASLKKFGEVCIRCPYREQPFTTSCRL